MGGPRRYIELEGASTGNDIEAAIVGGGQDFDAVIRRLVRVQQENKRMHVTDKVIAID